MDNATLQTVIGDIMLIVQVLIVVFLAYGAYLSMVVAREWTESPRSSKADRQASPVRESGPNPAAKPKNDLVNRGHPATRLPGFDVASR